MARVNVPTDDTVSAQSVCQSHQAVGVPRDGWADIDGGYGSVGAAYADSDSSTLRWSTHNVTHLDGDVKEVAAYVYRNPRAARGGV